MPFSVQQEPGAAHDAEANLRARSRLHQQIVAGRYTRLADLGLGLSPQLCDLMEQMLQVAPAQRITVQVGSSA